MNEVIWIAAAGGRLDYIVRFDLLSAKDNVPRSFDIDEM